MFIKVVDIDIEKKRFVLTAKPSELVPSTEEHDFFSKFNHVNLLEYYLDCRQEILKEIEQNKGKVFFKTIYKTLQSMGDNS